MRMPSKHTVEFYKANYTPGTRVRLIDMNDPYRNMPSGLLGTVECVDDMATVHVAWDNGCHLGAVWGEDIIEKVL